ncbi:MAG: Ig-like domain-containing protein [Undibacterium sp.]|nr:Ig-like domain-containing protein [Undibacterium sp.]
MKNMNQSGKRYAVGKLFRAMSAVVLIAMLNACGGGGGAAAGSGSTGTAGSTGSSDTATTGPVLSWTLTNAAGTAITTLSGSDTGILSAKFVDVKGAPLVGALVTITGDASLVQFIPSNGTALTNASGIAIVKVQPASLSASGSFLLKGQAVSSALTATYSSGLTIGSATLTLGALSFATAPPVPLPAFTTTVINIPVTSNGAPATSAPGLLLTSLCGNKADLKLGVATAPGQYPATYTNLGCLLGSDTITVSLGTSTQTIVLAVAPSTIGTIQFIRTDSPGQALVLKGSGGVGRKESALVTFKLVDQNNVGLEGVPVSFSTTTNTGGLTVLPIQATTDANGEVSTTVSSGTIPTPVKVIATATSQNKTIISGLSDGLTISAGLPIQRFMDLSADKLNIEGWDHSQEIAIVTVAMADQYGNKVADGTTVNFITEGGAIGSSAQGACNTINGHCSVELSSQAFRPTNGRVTILAYAQGLEDFVSSQGTSQYYCVAPVDANGNPVSQSAYRPLVDTCPANAGNDAYTDMGDAFLDTGTQGGTTGLLSGNTLDGVYEFVNNDHPIPYNHAVYTSAGDGKWGLNYIRKQAEFTFSGSIPTLIRMDCSSGSCVDWTGGPWDIVTGVAGVGCTNQKLNFRLIDVHNNPMPKGTTVSSGDSDKISLLTIGGSSIVSTANVGGTQHGVMIKADPTCAHGFVTILVKTPLGTSYPFIFNSH